jgi:hypothetical protein
MLSNIRNCRILWSILALLSLVAALVGVTIPDIYSLVLTSEILPGVISQDIVTIIASVTVLLLVATIDQSNVSRQIIILGVTGYLFYSYGIYVIEQLYTILYLLYMVIFSLSFYSIVYFSANIKREVVKMIRIPRFVRIASVVYLLINAIIFNIIWISQLIPLIQTGTKLEFLYSIYVLDLCFIMPLFFIVAIMVAKNRAPGLSLAPSLLVLGFLVLIPLTLAEISKPIFFGLPMAIEGLVLFLPLAVIFFILAAVYLWKMKIMQ